jgi:DNA-binding NarL/FixJ family response regulator
MRIYIVARYPTVRAGLATLVKSRPLWSVAGEVGPATPPLAPTGESSEGVVDVVLADLDGLDEPETVAQWLDAVAPRSGLVVIDAATAEGRRGAVRQAASTTYLLGIVARAAEDRGLAFGALPRDAGQDEIIAALDAVGSGLVVLDRRLAREFLANRQTATVATTLQYSEESGAIENLTARELEVLQLLAEGLPNKLIAQRLHITEHTAKFHVSSIMLKLGAASRTEAVTLAARRGLLLL